MGEDVYKHAFTPAEHQEFSVRLESQLRELRELLTQDAFNRREPSIGAELELYLVDNDCHLPAAVNEELLRLANHPQLTPELNRYNLEFNLSPVAASGKPFFAMEKELREFLDVLQGHALSIGSNIIPIGILPTLKNEHLSQAYMTDRARYHGLAEGICKLRGKYFHIDINGKDHLIMDGEGVTVEGANTSFQVHLRVAADEFAQVFNAAQLTTPMVLAMAANSPLIGGMRLWQESRIALFKQSIDLREHGNSDWRQPARVSFGHGWVREGAWELFAENVALYQPIMPVLYAPEARTVPRLPELSLHHGTIWPWNRAVYDATDGGHLRIEFRALPAGPTVIDMLANAALSIGWAVGLADSTDQHLARLPFHFAELNFYRAAQHGLDAKVIWSRKRAGGVEEIPIVDLIEEFLPRARIGLEMLGIDDDEIDRLWHVIERRFETRRTGAAWQLREYERYRESCDLDEACSRMLADYIDHVMEGNPVADWC
ncbi:Gamma-glutamyl:cysteine ligase YbdK, ATP-grasp superfamily [Nitrosomonas cryotolerans]|uniref:Gamma-glutamyl:cysteine ligase YbdK, ATP-grasp superfamily n=1 Tax=Nitrosomonas cryotolerans ATCC 49181 TaxID=1131553 RepID=A0A1N6GNS5_9PROT|nr:glutamate-cysteine ligase family protein [Nitrosomonas cryotolerans]SFP39216.1 Gamma-glutamyl:cysteine ligase YbdK, ATP-grasp superfamily [Nitrosomonas cryotolerans]SIO09137.1 Gamma-glutamyl:cysteine ligase YbdK, ATP-grasp superfamily [Nitrosomonas cryotolerans ATCC 49181]